MSFGMGIDHVKELQGFYGPFTLSEQVVQKIWLRQDFATSKMLTVSGRVLKVKDPGRWNLLEGPDFKDARLILDGIELVGDVEVHFNVSDWHNHQHELDHNFDRVVLHLVLHPERRHLNCVQTSQGHVPECLYLMPLLNRDLEAYAMDDALLELEQQDALEWVVTFLKKPLRERLNVLRQRAKGRWYQKLKYAKQRLKQDGWEASCHSYALEVLGYSRNRAPMLRLAAKYPLASMYADQLSVDALFAEEKGHWKLHGLRPSNHPSLRLSQYMAVVQKQPNWPDHLTEHLKKFPNFGESGSTSEFRRFVNIRQLCTGLRESIFNGVIGEKRFNTMVVDAILPLATAAGIIDGFPYWMHWFPGDSPDAIRKFLTHTGIISFDYPLSNGWNQGALALFLERHG
jgi:hypothetical protein